MRPFLLACALACTLLAGCTDLPTTDLRFEVAEARLQQGDCTFGPRDNASDPTFCHLLDVRATNSGSAPASTDRLDWEAQADDGRIYTMPRIDGATGVSAGTGDDLVLRFETEDDAVRLVALRWVGEGGPVVGQIPSY